MQSSLSMHRPCVFLTTLTSTLSQFGFALQKMRGNVAENEISVYFPIIFRQGDNMDFHCPSQIREHYGKLDLTSLQAEIEKAITEPNAEQTVLWDQWKDWLVRFSIYRFRSKELNSGVKRQYQWVAFALRY